MNLIEAWNTAESHNEMTLLDDEGGVDTTVVKKGTFLNCVRKLTELMSDEEIISERWAVK